MVKKLKQDAFEGQDFYIGLDVHKKQWTVSIRTDGLQLKRFSMNPLSRELVSYLHKNYPGGRYHVAYEAGFSGFWTHDQLVAAGVNCLVTNAPDIPSTHKDKERKNDRVDSSKLSRELEKGSLTPIFTPTPEHTYLRSLARHYRTTVKDCTRIKARIKGLINFYGLKVPEHTSHWPRPFIEFLRQMELDSALKVTLDLHLNDLIHHREMQTKTLKTIRIELRKREHEETIKLLVSIPGIGFKSAMILFTEIYDMKRFPTIDHLKSFAGLVPALSSSDEKEIQKGATKRRNRHVRFVLIESAWVAIRKDPVLLKAYKKLCVRMKPQQAITRIARKLLMRLRHVWLKREPYVLGVVE